MKKTIQYIAWLTIFLMPLPAAAAAESTTQAFTKEQLEWLESDSEAHPAAEVNEGELKFLSEKSDKPEHLHENQIWIDQAAIKTGWTKLRQCHTNLGVLGALDIAYKAGKVRDIKILSTRNIGRAAVIESRVELYDLKKDSKICIEAYSLTLEATADNHYLLSNGPFQRRFLDGYYPLRVSLQVHYPKDQLRLDNIYPAAQSGWTVNQQKNSVTLSGRFEGKLFTLLLFKPINNAISNTK